MGKKKIADSIIIKVGGGIREVPRETDEIMESLESGQPDAGFEQTEDVHPVGLEFGTNAKNGPDKLINR